MTNHKNSWSEKDCKYCGGKICDGKKKSISEWNKCPWHKADWEIETSIIYWFLGKLSFGIIKEIIFRYKLRKYSNQLKHLKHKG